MGHSRSQNLGKTFARMVYESYGTYCAEIISVFLFFLGWARCLPIAIVLVSRSK